MDDGEYDWAPDACRHPQLHDDTWQVEAAETAGPNYHRPGYTGLISSDYLITTDDETEAFNAVRMFIDQLSGER